MTLYVDLDFETASACDLKTAGAWAYAEHPTTEVLCLHFHCADYVPMDWKPGDTETTLYGLAADPETVFVAHNAGFEQAIWHHIMVPTFGFPPIPVERWEDTMATCAWKSLPLALDKGARALKLPIEKDKEGNKLTLSMSRANKKTGDYPARTADTIERISAYCAQDVAVEGAVRKRIGLLSEQSKHERQVWLADQRMNQRGVRIDLEFVRQAQLVVERATTPLLAEFRELTGGVNPGQVEKVKGWASTQGVELDNLQKEYLNGLLGGSEEDDAGYESLADDASGLQNNGRSRLPPRVYRVLAIRQMLGSASIKKLARMRACVGEDGRARGLLQYHAASTGRWGGRLFQPQNFPRGLLKCSPDQAVAAILTGDPTVVESQLGLAAIEAVASSLRHALIPDPGKVFLVGDFAGIEARIVLAMAGQHDKTAMMAAGEDVYLDMACDIYGAPKGSLTKADLEKRQTGKNSVLGCGFGMGPAKFHMRYCGEQPFTFAERVIRAYRKDWAPRVPKLWYALDDAAFSAATGSPDEAYGVKYQREGDWLTATLPSGWQKLWYYQPKLGRDEKFDRDCWSYSAHKGGRLSQVKAYGGLLTENAVQALARGLLCASVQRLEQANMPVVLTVHDEVVCEVDEGQADQALFEQLMAEPTWWAKEMRIPIAVEAWAGDRYRK